MAQTRHCPNCGTEAGDLQAICLHCGHSLPGVWPPSPTTGEPTLPPRPKTLTGRVWTDFLLGAAGQYVTHLVTARVLVYKVPIVYHHSRDWVANTSNGANFVLYEIFWAVIFGLALYYGLRPTYPAVARGSGYASEALLIVLLGAFVTCQPVTY